MTNRDDGNGRAPGAQELRLPDYAGWAEGDADVRLDLNQLQAELQREIAAERGPTAWLRSRTTPLRAMVAGGAVAALVMLTMVLWPRADHAVYPQARMAAALLSMAALLGINLVLVVWPLQLPAAPAWLTRAATAGAPLLLFGLYALPAAHEDDPRSVAPADLGALLEGTTRCLAIGSVVAAGVFALFRALDRGGTRRALLMAAGAGLAANLLLQLHCAVTTPAHLIVGHLGVLGLCFGVAALRAGSTDR